MKTFTNSIKRIVSWEQLFRVDTFAILRQFCSWSCCKVYLSSLILLSDLKFEIFLKNENITSSHFWCLWNKWWNHRHLKNFGAADSKIVITAFAWKLENLEMERATNFWARPELELSKSSPVRTSLSFSNFSNELTSSLCSRSLNK